MKKNGITRKSEVDAKEKLEKLKVCSVERLGPWIAMVIYYSIIWKLPQFRVCKLANHPDAYQRELVIKRLRQWGVDSESKTNIK